MTQMCVTEYVTESFSTTCVAHIGMMQYLVMVLPVNKLMLYFQEDMQQREKREARLKKLKEEHGSARWRAKRKVD